jgi:hypothetical protein
LLLENVALAIRMWMTNTSSVADTGSTGPRYSKATIHSVHISGNGIYSEVFESHAGIITTKESPGCESGRRGATDQRLSRDSETNKSVSTTQTNKAHTRVGVTAIIKEKSPLEQVSWLNVARARE